MRVKQSYRRAYADRPRDTLALTLHIYSNTLTQSFHIYKQAHMQTRTEFCLNWEKEEDREWEKSMVVTWESRIAREEEVPTRENVCIQ